jgi:hypothetical protein
MDHGDDGMNPIAGGRLEDRSQPGGSLSPWLRPPRRDAVENDRGRTRDATRMPPGSPLCHGRFAQPRACQPCHTHGDSVTDPGVT